MKSQLMNECGKLRASLMTGLTIFIISMSLVGLSGCTSSDNMNAGSMVVLKSNNTFGNILTDEKGNTLYFFSKDVSGQSTCEDGTCATNWPSYYIKDISVGAGLNAGDFSAITHSDSSKQTTYKGWPLYYYAGDHQSGDVSGDGISNVWFVAKPDYSVMIGMGQLTGLDGKNYTGDFQEGTGQTQYFTDSAGNTLYIFTHDSLNTNNYTKEDFSNDSTWPIFYSELKSLPGILSASDFGEIDVFGRKQLTYKGWPLYEFGPDAMRGETKGVSVPQPGIWPIVNASTAAAQ